MHQTFVFFSSAVLADVVTSFVCVRLLQRLHKPRLRCCKAHHGVTTSHYLLAITFVNAPEDVCWMFIELQSTLTP
jgi:hypothetical protein